MARDKAAAERQVTTGDIAEYLTSLCGSRKYGPQVVCRKTLKAEAAKYERTFPQRYAPTISELLGPNRHGLYSHQAEALECIQRSENTIVATGTASGKSMVYNIPVLHDLREETDITALYIFPLKALAQDQLKTLDNLAKRLKISTRKRGVGAIYDGDTSSYQRRKIREQVPPVLLTNPEMLHLSMLPHHESWKMFWGRLRYVVIDEVHSYRGILGSHMAWILRRLRRIARHYGAEPIFVLLSATIGNPRQLGKELLGEKLQVVNKSGAAVPPKEFIFINPWDSASYTAGQLLEAAVKRGLRTIVYTQSRKMTELITMWTSPRLGKYSDKVSSYRAGFLPEERRNIERRLFTGELLGVVCTSALELGLDIGDLDLCLLVGYPGSIMSTMQRGGRVGRGGKESAIIMIAQEDALDQHFMRNPEDFFQRKPESAVINPYNETIMVQHLQCCAAELPLDEAESLLKDLRIRECVLTMCRCGQLLELRSGGSWISPRKRPEREISLRGGGKQLAIIDTKSGEVVGEIDGVRAMKECHPGAVYLHNLTTYIVKRLDFHDREILVQSGKPRYFTRPSSEKHTEILEVHDTGRCGMAEVGTGRLRVREKVTGYRRYHTATQKQIDSHPLEMEEQVIETEGLWIQIPNEIVRWAEDGKMHFMGGIHAMEHGMIAMMPMLVLCDRNDIGGISCPMHDQTEKATIFIYDGVAGGVGLSREGFRKIKLLLEKTLEAVNGCQCETGCPSCVHSPKCGSGNRPIDKQACREILGKLLEEPKTDIAQDMRPVPVVFSQQDFSLRDQEAEQLILPERYGVFDLETCRSAEEVGGWKHVRRMGMSVGVVYDGLSQEFVTYLEDEAEQLVDHLASLDLVIGFNTIRFDNVVLSAYTDRDLSLLPNLDLLDEVYRQLGYRLSLNRLAEVTLGTQKSGDGLQALAWYREGRLDLLRQYCKKDVQLTRDLFFHALEHGFLLFENKAKKQVRLSLDLKTRIATLMDS